MALACFGMVNKAEAAGTLCIPLEAGADPARRAVLAIVTAIDIAPASPAVFFAFLTRSAVAASVPNLTDSASELASSESAAGVSNAAQKSEAGCDLSTNACCCKHWRTWLPRPIRTTAGAPARADR